MPKALVLGEALGVGGQGGGREACGEQGLVSGGMSQSTLSSRRDMVHHPDGRVRGETAAERKERHERGVQKGINVRIEKVSKKCRP